MSTTPQTSFAPVVAHNRQPVQIAMQRLLLTGTVLPVGARLIAQHIFRSEEEKPLEVVYSFPLPRDAALRRFRITGDNFEVHSELKDKEDARKIYEQGIAQGSLSALALLYGDAIVNLNLGNLRPRETVTVWLEILAGVESRDDGFRFRFPFTLAPRYHAGAKVAMVAPGEIEMELPASEFGDVILPPFREDPAALHQVGFDLIVSGELDLDELGSPSHPVRVRQQNSRAANISLATGKDIPNRDVVIDARLKTTAPQIFSGHDENLLGHFAAVVPSTSFGGGTETPRRVVILLDRSGSMKGEPLAQARKAIEACLSVLSESDFFGLVAFDNQPKPFKPTLQPATREIRDDARKFLQKIDARGGTELVLGFHAAAALLKEGGGDIFVLTDGQVAGTETILENARKTGVRLHCLGIGSASQDRLLTMLARETGGVSRFVTPRERVDLSALDLFASVGRPVALGLQAGANIEPQPAAVVFSGTPVILFGEGNDQIDLTWDAGRLTIPVSFDDNAVADTVRLLQGSRLITDWESRYPASEALGPIEKRKESRVANRLRELSMKYGLASREMSLVAVLKREGDRPGELPETRVVPVHFPELVQPDAYLNVMSTLGYIPVGASRKAPSQPPIVAEAFLGRPNAAPKEILLDGFPDSGPRQQAPASPLDFLLELATRLEPDGGLPGDDLDARVQASLVALLAFFTQGCTPDSGPFRRHARKLLGFLKSIYELTPNHQQVLESIVAALEKGQCPPGDWIAIARAGGNSWDDLIAASARAK